MKLYLFNYNNYYNRIVKHESNLYNYGTPLYSLVKVNFVYNDGINTSVIVNYNNNDGDYCIITDDNDVIKSRWFVIENAEERYNQHRLYLKRDVIADNYNSTITAPMIIDRAIINDTSNPLLYNPEGFSFNQIKKEEILLKDATNSAWYVLYFKKGLADKAIKFTPEVGIADHTISTTIENSIFGSGTKNWTTDARCMISYIATDGGGHSDRWKYMRYAIKSESSEFYGISLDGAVNDLLLLYNSPTTVRTRFTNTFAGQFNNLFSDILHDEGLTNQLQPNEFVYLDWDGEIVKDSLNNLYRVHIESTFYNAWKYKTSGFMKSRCRDLIDAVDLEVLSQGSQSYACAYNNIQYTFSYEPIDNPAEMDIVISWDVHTTTQYSDYNILAIPYHTTKFKINDNDYTVPQDWSYAFLQAIMRTYTADSGDGSAELVDIQILPYFPNQNEAAYPLVPTNTETSSHDIYVHEGVNRGVIIYYVKDANFNVALNNNDYMINVESTAVDRKIQNETQLVRLCSPNYNGQFEFSAAKNNGVNGWRACVTLKPYTPYIRVNPYFKGLYGQDFNDARGLICGGDFSIPIWSTAWQQYQLNNKNYQQIFDRQIQNMDFNNDQERILSKWQIAAGTIKGTTSGAISGAMTFGNPAAAIGGGVIGGVSSLAGGLKDYSMLKERQAENKDLAIDMFNFQLGNIKALPYSLNKVTPLTYNNKMFPFIEIYEATEEEKDLLRNYLTYKSMAVNAVGSIIDYLQSDKTFIQGTPIRLDVNMPANELYEIFNELKQGVYI